MVANALFADGAAAAVIAQCDRGGYAEDTAPTDSHALHSTDTVTWTAHELEGEAHEEPGISPDGQSAVWPLHGRYTTRTASGYSFQPWFTPDSKVSPAPFGQEQCRVSSSRSTCVRKEPAR